MSDGIRMCEMSEEEYASIVSETHHRGRRSAFVDIEDFCKSESGEAFIDGRSKIAKYLRDELRPKMVEYRDLENSRAESFAKEGRAAHLERMEAKGNRVAPKPSMEIPSKEIGHVLAMAQSFFDEYHRLEPLADGGAESIAKVRLWLENS